MVRDPSVAVSLDALPKAPAPPKSETALKTSVAGPAESRSVDGPKGGGSVESAPKKRKVNTSSKGTAIELAAIKVLEAEGYKVHRCVRTGVKRGPFYYSQSNDVFGCIDLVAKKKGTRTRWIQVTADGGIGRKKADLAEVPWDPVFDSVEIWRWVGGQNRKHKTTGAFLERQYFQVYHLDQGYALDKDKRIPLVTPNPTPGGAAT
ncbi:MAG TPA: hypothetical protein VM327_10500 [Candidatus Thermoplasmatota archaeon]|nr:hypothetical protein [Candidatus Thermoplasmatota archaeon]